ncbi:glycoside hydrolase family 3 protein [Thermothelomyces thermophilus ATCC 42464]|uniref:xylan 1,4-beta-xylosidase n=1 Tax=Thermothelomyces thermophilus (strain ATCC 42464 / BCRC 31852 / DSM 1799) TaxID=573729 RepID=G2QKP9_THET4|nr:glycoside hydrolase family 3 protein [Thermothelomyces thermophilus ATCC 42464]AEO60531.1 glycoside hydrolase family 3 protein [Thermothelomyces thermophilus ATCC 42464]
MSAVAYGLDGPFQTYPDCTKPPLSDIKVCDRTLPEAERAAALVAALTDEEKLQNLVSKAPGAPRIGLPAYNWWSEALHGVAHAPGTQFRDGPGDFNSSTSFPMPLLMAAAFDDELIEAVGDVIGTEARAFGNAGWSGLDYWTPNVNPFRDPRWGRGSETPGEDVVRLKRYAASMIRGLEGRSSSSSSCSFGSGGEPPRVISTCKHYAGNDFEDWNGTTRHDFDAVISAQDLAEYYLAPFQQCARDSRVGSVMCAYNAVNGVPSCANSYLMNTILRGHWNWTEHDNYVTSDCEAVLDVSAHHHYADTNAEGTGLCFEAGMDTSCEYEGSSDIPGASAGGFLTWPAVDRALTRLYRSLVRVGYFDGPESPHASLGWADVNRPEAQELALRAAVEGIVLLKNDNDTLPLPLPDDVVVTADGGRRRVAMIGFWADAPDKLFGGYSGAPPFARSPASAARQLGWNVTVAGGPVLEGDSDEEEDTWTAPAVEAAADADYIVYFGGLDTSAAGETKDRMTIGWPAAQLALISELARLGKPVVVVQMGDQLDDTPLFELDGVGAVLWANWPGQDGGTAVVRLLSGAESPAGRLPVTQYPANYTDAVPLTDMTLRPSATNPGRTYRWYPTPVRPFGFGLHYTTFRAEFGPHPFFPGAGKGDGDGEDKGESKSEIRTQQQQQQQQQQRRAAAAATTPIRDLLRDCDKTYPDTCPLPPLTVRVTNEGERASDYVVLAFVSGEYGPAPYPIKTLVSYARARGLKGKGGDGDGDGDGATTTVSLDWTVGNLARHDERGNTILYPGTYTLTLDEPAQASVQFALEGEPVVLDEWPAPPSANSTARGRHR